MKAETQSFNLADELVQRAPYEAAALLEEQDDEAAVQALDTVNPLIAQQILHELDDRRRAELLAAAPVEMARQWMRNREYPEDSVGWLMEPPVAVFRPHMTVGETVEALRMLTKKSFITYGYVTDENNKLVGVLVMRDLMLSESGRKLQDVMYTNLFTLVPEMELTDAMTAVLNRHVPVYPVCNRQGHLLGLVRGQDLFEARAIELSAQPGNMVGVNEEERLGTPVRRSLWMRHPWLQVNLLTAFAAGAVVGLFQDTLDRVVILAAFLPILAGQSGNTGCQALAVCLRGLTLGDLKQGDQKRLFVKEAVLGFWNGVLVGIVAALGMFGYAMFSGRGDALMLALVVWVAMVVSCVVSGVAGALIPLVLRRFGADPATASSIFLTTATDVISMGTFLGLATLLVDK
ncbi:magnesium transporter [Phragmitibacter flavus]|uniref:Magnesium transporter n=1 Tax=Phragmitibacter flavus TaxID=2576071 RepID=A0A5R8KDU3_9BACT|nr:magnesium transporter [Phragmitibacter flavus]TLD70466.1 magnesium transporter [Phragmitibacter flavus]